jgi:hypothetical protein
MPSSTMPSSCHLIVQIVCSSTSCIALTCAIHYGNCSAKSILRELVCFLVVAETERSMRLRGGGFQPLEAVDLSQISFTLAEKKQGTAHCPEVNCREKTPTATNGRGGAGVSEKWGQEGLTTQR